MYHKKKKEGIFFWNIWILNITGRLQRWRCIGRIGRHADNILEDFRNGKSKEGHVWKKQRFAVPSIGTCWSNRNNLISPSSTQSSLLLFPKPTASQAPSNEYSQNHFPRLCSEKPPRSLQARVALVAWKAIPVDSGKHTWSQCCRGWLTPLQRCCAFRRAARLPGHEFCYFLKILSTESKRICWECSDLEGSPRFLERHYILKRPQIFQRKQYQKPFVPWSNRQWMNPLWHLAEEVLEPIPASQNHIVSRLFGSWPAITAPAFPRSSRVSHRNSTILESVKSESICWCVFLVGKTTMLQRFPTQNCNMPSYSWGADIPTCFTIHVIRYRPETGERTRTKHPLLVTF